MRGIRIRLEQACDIPAIRALTTRAFAPMPFTAGDEQDVIDRLRTAGALSLSLVGVDNGIIVGHAAFSPVQSTSGVAGWFGLGPVSVEPKYQRQGIGKKLITFGLGRLRAWGAKGCVVVGDTNYYPRFGFQRAPGAAVPPEPPEHFMVLSLDGSDPGKISFHKAFYGNV